MSTIARCGWWMMVLALAACGSGGGATDAADGGADVAPDGGDATGDAEAADTADAADGADAPAPLDLSLGQVVELTPGTDGNFTADLATPGDAREFGVVLYSAAWATGTLSYTFSATGAAASTAAATKEAGAPAPRAGRDFMYLVPQLARATREGRARIGHPPVVPPPPPDVGDHRSFQISDASGAVLTIDAECIKVGTNLVAWMDRTTAGGTDPDPATLDGVVSGFDDPVLPRERTYFGHEPDINGDGVVNLVWSPIVSTIGAMAYFYPCDMYDPTALPFGCSYSNQQEVLYATPPSMLPGYMASASSILDVVSHEFQHLIYFDHKVLLGGAPGDENPYVMEGWAQVGEDVCGYGRGIFFIQQEGLDASDQYGAIDILRSGVGYDADPDRNNMLYGASYMFIRYLWDRAGGETVESDGSITDHGSVAWAHETIDSAREGTTNYQTTVGAPIDDIVFDWYTALLLTGRKDAAGHLLPVEPRFTYLPQATDPITGNPRGLDPYADFMGMFTLTGAHTVTPATADGVIPGTGNELIIVDADGTSPTLSLSVTAPAVTKLRVRVARIR